MVNIRGRKLTRNPPPQKSSPIYINLNKYKIMVRQSSPGLQNTIQKPTLKYKPAGKGPIKATPLLKINPNDSTVKRKCARRYNKINELQRQIKQIQEQMHAGVEPIYKKDTHPALALSYCLLGCTDEKLARLLGIHVETLKLWREQDDEFDFAIIEGREVANANVAKSLYHRACGYSMEEKEYRQEFKKDIDGNIIRDEDGYPIREIILHKLVKKHMPADVASAKFFLWNRTKTLPKAEQWNDRQDIDITTGDTPIGSAVIILPQKEMVG